MEERTHLEQIVLLAARLKDSPRLTFTDICKAFDKHVYEESLPDQLARRLYRRIVSESTIDDQFYLKYSRQAIVPKPECYTPKKEKQLSLSFTKSLDAKSFDVASLSGGKERAIYQEIRERISQLEHPRRLRKRLLHCFN